MSRFFEHIKPDEEYLLKLSCFYEEFGYKKYNMRHFEEYSVYAENKSFLVNESVITFMDMNGKLMALKPDVTLSILKHADSNAEQRVYYTENVYRPDREKTAFCEITQTGLERFGVIDDFALAETVYLAASSLSLAMSDSILELSHVGFIDCLLDECAVYGDDRNIIKYLISEKNTHELESITNRLSISENKKDAILAIPFLNGNPNVVYKNAKKYCLNDGMKLALELLYRVSNSVLQKNNKLDIRFDLSMYGDSNYYSGILMSGYINGLPARVLSGGQYDNMAKKFGKDFGAVGYAIYISDMERIFCSENKKRRILLTYNDCVDPTELIKYVETLNSAGALVFACKEGCPHRFDYDEVVSYKGGSLC